MHHGHQGRLAAGVGAPHADERVRHVDERLAAADPRRGGYGVAADPYGTAGGPVQSPGHAGQAVRGVVVFSLPYHGWYKVQVGRGAGWVACCALAETGLLAPGPRPVGCLPPGSQVLVQLPHGLPYGVILGAIPYPAYDGNALRPSQLVQGCQAGVKREDAYKQPAKAMYRGGGVIDFSANRPLDSTCWEWGRVTETGIALLVDSFQAFLRVNELCGLFLNLFDSHTRLAGVQLDVQSAVHEQTARDDEGEALYEDACATHPWEATGLYAPGEDFTQEFDDRDVQYEKARGKVDLPEGKEDVQPFYRYREHGGYLGQGRLREVAAPPKPSGVRRFADKDPDPGVFQESVALDGSYAVSSAKWVLIGKRGKIVTPKRVRPPEDGLSGDDAEADNYKFAGQFGAGPDHKVGDVKVTGEARAAHRVAAAIDFLSYHANWKALHPFHYHRGDFDTPQEADVRPGVRRSEVLPFGALAAASYLPDPAPRPLRIDHRYNAVDTYERESFLFLAEDGAVALAAGGGEQLAFAGGQARLEAPGDVVIASGGTVAIIAEQIVLKARRSIDGTAAQHDVRFKAERNYQVVAGNGGVGGVLLESKATADVHQYKGVVGEDVRSSGVVLRSKTHVAALARDIYLRTGADTPPGNITLDAAKGAGVIAAYAKRADHFVDNGFTVWHGTGPAPTASHRFAEKTTTFSGSLYVYDQFIAGGAAIVGGSLAVRQGVAAGGKMADSTGMFVGKVPAEVIARIAAAVDQEREGIQQVTDSGAPAFTGDYDLKYYADGRLGNDDLIKTIAFSLRDDGDGRQYQTRGTFRLAETRWQQLARLGGASGGAVPFEETAVAYDGRELMPWPGKRQWEGGNLLRVPAFKFYDAGGGHSVARPGPYEDAALPDWELATPAAGFTLVRGD